MSFSEVKELITFISMWMRFPSLPTPMKEFNEVTQFGAFELEEGQRSKHSWGSLKIIYKWRMSSLLPRVCLLDLGNSETFPKAALKY